MHSFTRASRDISRYVLRKSFVKRQRGCREFPCRTLTRFARVSRELFINFAGSTGFSGLDEPPSILPFCATVIPESARREGLPLGWNMPRNAIRNKGPPTNRRANKSRGSDSPIRIRPTFPRRRDQCATASRLRDLLFTSDPSPCAIRSLDCSANPPACRGKGVINRPRGGGAGIKLRLKNCAAVKRGRFLPRFCFFFFFFSLRATGFQLCSRRARVKHGTRTTCTWFHSPFP